MKKIYAGLMIAFIMVLSAMFGPLVTDAHSDFASSGMLYNNGYMRGVLTRQRPAPWKVVEYYVGNNPKLIVSILHEQNINPGDAAKYHPGMTITIPQKYVLKELLPSPSAAEVALKDAERRAEVERFHSLLREKDKAITVHYWAEFVLFAILLILTVAMLRFRKKFTGASLTVDAAERELIREQKDKKCLAAHVERLNKERDELHKLLAKKDGQIVELHTQNTEHTEQFKQERRKLHETLEGKDTQIKEMRMQTTKDILSKLTGREINELLEWGAVVIPRGPGSAIMNKKKLQNLSDLMVGNPELYDMPLELWSGHLAAKMETNPIRIETK